MINKKIIGLDISDYSIEAVEMEQEGADERIIAYNRLVIEPGIVERGIIKNKKKLADAIKQAFASAKPLPISSNQIVFGLSESRIFLHFFSVDNKNMGDLPKRIKDEAVSIIPIAKNDMVLAYKVINQEDGSGVKNILTVAASQGVLDDWKRFFKSISLDLVFFDIESLASFRGLFDELPAKPICLVDLGAETISLSIFSSFGLEYNYQMQYGGKYISAKIAAGLRIEQVQAETMKKETALLPDGRNNAAREILQTVFTHVSEEIKRNIDYFLEKHPQYSEIEKIILIGGSSRFKGLSEFFAEKGMSKVFAYQNSNLKYPELSIEYLEAIGLGRRFFQGYWQNDPLFVSEKNVILKKIPNIKRLLRLDFFKRIYDLPLKIKIGALAVVCVLVLFSIIPENKKSIDEKNTPEKAGLPEIKKEEKDIVVPIPDIPVEVIKIKQIKIQDIGANLNVRVIPDKSAGIASQVKSGAIYTVVEEKPDWFKIEYEKGKFGWVVSQYVDEISSE